MSSTSNTLQQLVLRETDDGLKLIRFLVDVMDAEIEGVKTTDRTAAARELLDRCFGKPFTAADRTAEVSDDGDDASNVLLDRIMMSDRRSIVAGCRQLGPRSPGCARRWSGGRLGERQ